MVYHDTFKNFCPYRANGLISPCLKTGALRPVSVTGFYPIGDKIADTTALIVLGPKPTGGLEVQGAVIVSRHNAKVDHTDFFGIGGYTAPEEGVAFFKRSKRSDPCTSP